VLNEEKKIVLVSEVKFRLPPLSPAHVARWFDPEKISRVSQRAREDFLAVLANGYEFHRLLVNPSRDDADMPKVINDNSIYHLLHPNSACNHTYASPMP
jgi:hypothetical protein